jgi:hypothetical protein
VPPPPKHRRIPSSAIGGFVRRDEIDALLTRFVPDESDRAWIVRCVLDEGPAHHRGANYVLLSLLGQVLARLPPGLAAGAEPVARAREVRVPMRVHPHHDHHDPDRDEDATFPLGVPLAPLDRLAPRDSREQAAMIDCLTDGPPQHALANAAMVHLLDEILHRLPAREGPPATAHEPPRSEGGGGPAKKGRR